MYRDLCPTHDVPRIALFWASDARLEARLPAIKDCSTEKKMKREINSTRPRRGRETEEGGEKEAKRVKRRESGAQKGHGHAFTGVRVSATSTHSNHKKARRYWQGGGTSQRERGAGRNTSTGGDCVESLTNNHDQLLAEDDMVLPCGSHHGRLCVSIRWSLHNSMAQRWGIVLAFHFFSSVIFSKKSTNRESRTKARRYGTSNSQWSTYRVATSKSLRATESVDSDDDYFRLFSHFLYFHLRA